MESNHQNNKTMQKKKRIPIYKLEIEYNKDYNLLSFIPSVFVSARWTSMYINLKWLFISCCLYIVYDANTMGNYVYGYITPFFGLRKVASKWREKYEFSFEWLWMHYRKFFGTNNGYDQSLKETIGEQSVWWIKTSKKSQS